MIKNQRQRALTKAKLDEFDAFVETLTDAIERQHYSEMADELRREIADYDAIAGGEVTEFRVDDVGDVGQALILARVARGWSQKDLAERLSTHEQQVQRWEDRDYENVTLWRCADVADALSYEFDGFLRPRGAVKSSYPHHIRFGAGGDTEAEAWTAPTERLSSKSTDMARRLDWSTA